MREQVLDNYIIFDESTGTYSMDPEQAVRDDVEKHAWLNYGRTILKDWRLYLMLVPMLFVFICWRYLPMYELLACFKDTSNTALSVTESPFAGFTYFKELFTGSYAESFWPAFRNTFMLSFYGLLFGFPFPIILALLLNEIRSNGVRSVYQVLMYLPRFLSTVVVTSLTILLLEQSGSAEGSQPGVIARLLAAIGLISQETAESGILNDPKYFRAIYHVTGIWEDAGYGSIVFFAAIIAVSPTSYEAAQIDGAGKMQQMRYVVLPSILSTVIIMLIMRIGNLLAVGYEKVLLLSEGRKGIYQTAEVISTFAHRLGVGDGSTQQGLASAAEMINNLIGMILVIGANTIARKASDVSLY